MAQQPSVAVVVVNFNGGEIVERCLEALAAQTRPPDRTIVVDNASTDGSAGPDRRALPGGRADPPRARTSGFAGGNNVGVARGRGLRLGRAPQPRRFPRSRRGSSGCSTAAERRPEYSFFGSLLLRADDPTRSTAPATPTTSAAWRGGATTARPLRRGAPRTRRDLLALRRGGALPARRVPRRRRLRRDASSRTTRTATSPSGCACSASAASTCPAPSSTTSASRPRARRARSPSTTRSGTSSGPGRRTCRPAPARSTSPSTCS